MEFQTFAAAGRVSEFLGAGQDNSYIKYDRSMRRLGMVRRSDLDFRHPWYEAGDPGGAMIVHAVERPR